MTNIIGIVFASSFVFFWQFFRRKVSAVLILALTLGGLLIVVPPLGISMDNLLIRNQVKRNLTTISSSVIPIDPNVQITNLNVRIRHDVVFVSGNVLAPSGLLTQERVDDVQEQLSKMLEKPVVLEFAIIPQKIIRSTKKTRL